MTIKYFKYLGDIFEMHFQASISSKEKEDESLIDW